MLARPGREHGSGPLRELPLGRDRGDADLGGGMRVAGSVTRARRRAGAGNVATTSPRDPACAHGVGHGAVRGARDQWRHGRGECGRQRHDEPDEQQRAGIGAHPPEDAGPVQSLDRGTSAPLARPQLGRVGATYLPPPRRSPRSAGSRGGDRRRAGARSPTATRAPPRGTGAVPWSDRIRLASSATAAAAPTSTPVEDEGDEERSVLGEQEAPGASAGEPERAQARHLGRPPPLVGADHERGAGEEQEGGRRPPASGRPPAR